MRNILEKDDAPRRMQVWRYGEEEEVAGGWRQ